MSRRRRMAVADSITALRVSGYTVGGHCFVADRRQSLTPRPATSVRVLDSVAVRRQLPRAVTPDTRTHIDVIDDLSGSMYGGNDATGLRHEAALIALEHIVARQRRRAPWSTRITSFDMNAPIDTPMTVLDRPGLAAVQSALLAAAPGGSSRLGPALTGTENYVGPRLLVVMSDFQLFDGDVPAVLRQLINSSAGEVLALVFRSAPPASLLSTRVRVVPIDPATTPPSAIAAHIVDAANAVARIAQGDDDS